MPAEVSQNSGSITQTDVERLLQGMGMNFNVSGRVDGSLRFASLRAPCRAGIYYLVSGTSLPGIISDSLIITDSPPTQAGTSNGFIILTNPKLAFYKLMRTCHALPVENGTVHPTAIVASDVYIPADTTVGAYCVIESGVIIGRRCFLDSHVVVKSGASIGDGSRVEPHSTIGATGVAWVWDENGRDRVIQPQTGTVRIGANVFIGSDVTIVRGSVNEVTEIGDGTLIAHGSKIGHGCRIGRQVHMANNVSIAGNVDAADRVFFGSGSVVRPHIHIARDVVVGAGAVVTKNVDTARVTVAGVPARILAPKHTKLAGVPENPNIEVADNE